MDAHKHLIIQGSMNTVLNKQEVRQVLRDLVETCGMEYMGDLPDNPIVGFDNSIPDNTGVTGVAIITTSHIAIHTWDNDLYFQLDVYSCREFSKHDIFECIQKHDLNVKFHRMFDREYEIYDIEDGILKQ